MFGKSVLFILCLAASLPLLSQVVPSATEGGLPLSIGAGFSAFNPDYGKGHIDGGTLWIDYNLSGVRFVPRGFSVELEGRDLSMTGSYTGEIRREDYAGIGALYHWRHFQNFRPYVKCVGGLGNADYLVKNNRRYNQSRTVIAFGGGIDYRVFRTLWVRGDYEYQDWPDFFVGYRNNGALDPQGITLGVVYRFSRDHPGR